MEAVQVRPPDQPDPRGWAPAGSQARSEPAPIESAGAPRELPTTDFVTCYELHYRRLVRALELAGADRSTAEDVAQEAFARALVHWWRVRRGTNPPGYVYTAGFRLLSRAQRRQSADRSRDDEPVPVAGGTDPTGATATSSVAVQTALSAMPPRRRACAVMCLIVGLSVKEAGEALGIADGTVRKHLDEARKDLAAGLGLGLGLGGSDAVI